MNKKLQVFVSSTYTDLIEERQAAVQAILDAGHIPAGMELFKAGNESQLKTIYKWIDESDVYMLILGGRYGSIEEKSSKSYTQLEYEYALSKNIPVFAVVLSESFLTDKVNSLGLSNVIEQKSPDKYQDFKVYVMSKIIREVNDCKDIKIAILTTLGEFLNEYDLIGWIRNTSENNTLQLIKTNNKLLNENDNLNKQIQELQKQLCTKEKEQLGRYTFDEITATFREKDFRLPTSLGINGKIVKSMNAIECFHFYFYKFVTGISSSDSSEESKYIFNNIVPYYVGFGLLERVKIQNTMAYRVHTTKLGDSFYALLETYYSFDY